VSYAQRKRSSTPYAYVRSWDLEVVLLTMLNIGCMEREMNKQSWVSTLGENNGQSQRNLNLEPATGLAYVSLAFAVLVGNRSASPSQIDADVDLELDKHRTGKASALKETRFVP